MSIRFLNLIILGFWQTSFILAANTQAVLQKALEACAKRPSRPAVLDQTNKYYVFDMATNQYHDVSYNWIKYAGNKPENPLKIIPNIDNKAESDAPKGYKPYRGNIYCKDIANTDNPLCGPDAICQNEFYVDACFGKSLEQCILGTLNHSLTTEPGYLPKIRVNRPIETITEIYYERGAELQDLPFKHVMCDRPYYYGLYGLLNIMGDPSQDIGCPYDALRNMKWDNKESLQNISGYKSASISEEDKDLNANFITKELDGLLFKYYDLIIKCLLSPINKNTTGLIDRQIVFQEGLEKINGQFEPKPLFVCQNLAGQSIGLDYDFKSRTILTTDDKSVGYFPNADIVITGNNGCISAPNAKICVACNGGIIYCPKAKLNFTQGGQVNTAGCDTTGSSYVEGYDALNDLWFPVNFSSEDYENNLLESCINIIGCYNRPKEKCNNDNPDKGGCSFTDRGCQYWPPLQTNINPDPEAFQSDYQDFF